MVAIVIALASAIAAIRGCSSSDVSAHASKSSAATAVDALRVSENTLELSREQLSEERMQTRMKRLNEEASDREDRKVEIFLQMAQTESRYRMIRPDSLELTSDRAPEKSKRLVELEILVRENGKTLVPVFRLPRAVQLVYRQQTLPNGTPLPVELIEQPLAIPITIENVSPFECIDCTNNFRLNLYVQAKQLRPKVAELRPSELVSLARAANDFADVEVAERALTSASQKLANQDYPVAYQSEVTGEIGKTYLIMGDLPKGYAALESSRQLWVSQEHPYRTNPIYDLLLWEAQFSCRNNDKKRALERLELLAKNVQNLSVSASRQSSLTHGAYASCIAILGEFSEYDPLLPVPAEYLLRDNQGQWTTPSAILKRAVRGDQLPMPMVWE
jgi:hypothetical protein